MPRQVHSLIHSTLRRFWEVLVGSQKLVREPVAIEPESYRSGAYGCMLTRNDKNSARADKIVLMAVKGMAELSIFSKIAGLNKT